MAGYDSDEFLTYDFDELSLCGFAGQSSADIRKQTVDRQGEYNNNRIAQVNKNLRNINRKFNYGIDEYTDEEEVDEGDINQGLSDCDSSTDEELVDEEMSADFLSLGGSKTMEGKFTRLSVTKSRTSPKISHSHDGMVCPAMDLPSSGGDRGRSSFLEDVRKLDVPRTVEIVEDKRMRRRGTFKCSMCAGMWQSSNVYCRVVGVTNGQKVYQPINAMRCRNCNTKNYATNLKPPGKRNNTLKRRRKTRS